MRGKTRRELSKLVLGEVMGAVCVQAKRKHITKHAGDFLCNVCANAASNRACKSAHTTARVSVLSQALRCAPQAKPALLIVEEQVGERRVVAPVVVGDSSSGGGSVW